MSKLELGTWSERLIELANQLNDCQSFEHVKTKVDGIVRWWDNCGAYMEKNSTPLGGVVQKIIEMQKTENPFPEGMDSNWALDVQSAQTMDFFATVLTQNKEAKKVAWDLGTLTGISAAVLAQHFEKVVTVEREEALVKFARKHLESHVEVVQSEIDAFLAARAAAGEQADFIFMDLDKTCYEPIYKAVRRQGLLKPGGLLLADNVLYRGLTAQLDAGEEIDVSDKTRANAQALVRFNELVKKDVADGQMKSLMLPVRDGMLAVMLR